MTAVVHGGSIDGQTSVSYRLWTEARRSVLVALALLLVLGSGFAAFLQSLPALQVRMQEADHTLCSTAPTTCATP